MIQVKNNSEEQVLLGDFPRSVDNAVMDSGDAHMNQQMQLLSDPVKMAEFTKLILNSLKNGSYLNRGV